VELSTRARISFARGAIREAFGRQTTTSLRGEEYKIHESRFETFHNPPLPRSHGVARKVSCRVIIIAFAFLRFFTRTRAGPAPHGELVRVSVIDAGHEPDVPRFCRDGARIFRFPGSPRRFSLLALSLHVAAAPSVELPRDGEHAPRIIKEPCN